jgi:hypothetical protein
MYAECGGVFPPLGYVEREGAGSATSAWGLDCAITQVGKCAKGYYDAGGMKCTKCPNDNELSPGGLSTTCVCPSGKATAGMLAAVGGAPIAPWMDQYCYDCKGGVSMQQGAKVLPCVGGRVCV